MKDGIFFLDSGAHSLYNQYVWKNKRDLSRVRPEEYAFYDTSEFWQYVDQYAEFVKKHEQQIDFYANVDVIYNPEKTWQVQKYLENEHGLSPVPVVHYNTGLKWIDKYLNRGYEVLGVGGLGQGVTKGPYLAWCDNLFRHICPISNGSLPVIKTHGFAMTAYSLMLRYPWWSVDSATWTKVGAFGSILIPHKRRGEFVFSEEPYQMAVSVDSPHNQKTGKHYQTLAPAEKKILQEWLEVIDVPLGVGSGDNIQEYGVINRHTERKIANLLFFEMFRASLPEWPWPFKRRGVLV